MTGTRKTGQWRELPVPSGYLSAVRPGPEGLPSNVAALYTSLAEAIRTGTPVEPDFTTALTLHRLLDTVNEAADTGHRHRT